MTIYLLVFYLIINAFIAGLCINDSEFSNRIYLALFLIIMFLFGIVVVVGYQIWLGLLWIKNQLNMKDYLVLWFTKRFDNLTETEMKRVDEHMARQTGLKKYTSTYLHKQIKKRNNGNV